jgi:hypothetical protein
MWIDHCNSLATDNSIKDLINTHYDSLAIYVPDNFSVLTTTTTPSSGSPSLQSMLLILKLVLSTGIVSRLMK